MTNRTAVVSPTATEESMAEEKKNSSVYIPEDIIIEILKHCSLKSLAKANCISKLWQTLISSKHLSTSSTTPLQHGFFFQSHNNGVPTFNFFPSSPHFPATHFPNTTILASSNGLLLCGRSKTNPIVHYSVWNPISKQRISIPKPRNIFSAVKLGFHSHDYDSFTILRLGNEYITTIEIFASETGEWRRLDLDLKLYSFFVPFEGPSAAVLNGLFYWLEFGSMVYVLDLFKSEYRKVEFPFEEMVYRRNVVSRCLAVAGGEVVLASTDGKVVEIWILRERYSWDLKCRFSVEGLVDINANTLRASPGAAAAYGRRFVKIVGFPAWDSERIYLSTAEAVFCCGVGTEKVEIVHRFHRSLEYSSTFFPFHCY